MAKTHVYDLIWYTLDSYDDEHPTKVSCEFEYDPGEPAAEGSPGWGDSMTLTAAFNVNVVDVLRWISEADVKALEQEALDLAHEWK